MNDKPFAAATERNSDAILGVLYQEFQGTTSVLEIGSGTGQHAVHFGRALGHLDWQTSDLAENHQGINAWLDHAALPNVRAPVSLDVRDAEPATGTYDGVFSANTAHIMGIDAVEKMFLLVARALCDGGMFLLYGPFRLAGRFNTVSNERFHESLQQRDAAMGIRDLEALDELAQRGNMVRSRLYAMPANNYIAVWCKEKRRH